MMGKAMMFPAKLLGIPAGKAFAVVSGMMAVGTAEALVNPSPLQSWATIAGAIATSITAAAALLSNRKSRGPRRNPSRVTRRRKPRAIPRGKPNQKSYG